MRLPAFEHVGNLGHAGVHCSVERAIEPDVEQPPLGSDDSAEVCRGAGGGVSAIRSGKSRQAAGSASRQTLQPLRPEWPTLRPHTIAVSDSVGEVAWSRELRLRDSEMGLLWPARNNAEGGCYDDCISRRVAGMVGS